MEIQDYFFIVGIIASLGIGIYNMKNGVKFSAYFKTIFRGLHFKTDDNEK